MFDIVLSFNGVDEFIFVLGYFFLVSSVLFLNESEFFSIGNRELVDFVQSNLVEIVDLFLLVSLVLFDFEFELVENGNQLFVLLLDHLLVRSHPMQHVEIVVLVHQSLSVQSVVILS